MQRLNREIRPDVILLARGGGSMEDLWAFNNEDVVKAIVYSDAPVITGIGHETDFTLADFAADMRAPTPTGAAVLATPSGEDLLAGVIEVTRQISDIVTANLAGLRFDLDQTSARLKRECPLRRVERGRQMVDALSSRMDLSMAHRVVLLREYTKNASNRLYALDPRAVLNRGYALVRLPDGTIVSNANQLAKETQTTTIFAHGSAKSRVESTSLD
jgi:exodeoxyribonuclease VII large subunit